MVTTEHQRLVNTLALRLESEWNVRIVQIDMRGTPELFDAKYHKLDSPGEHGGRIPDLVGKDANGLIHLGEAETDMDAENLDGQLSVFSNRVMNNNKAPIPLHVIVPVHLKPQMQNRIDSLRRQRRLGQGGIHVWSV